LDWSTDIRDLDWRALLRAPLWMKALALAGLALILTALFWWLVGQPSQRQAQRLESQAQTLKARLERRQRQLAELPGLEQRVGRLENRLVQARQRLPEGSEVASLLVDVTRAGREEGLSFRLFRPKEEQAGEYLAEVPVEVAVAGSYNELGGFLAAAANLPRIVHFDHMRIQPAGDGLLMRCRARTYRYRAEADPGSE
jgi:type IV pilus assembly protein PilO